MRENIQGFDELIVLGPEYSYSEVLARQMIDSCAITYGEDFSGVLQYTRENPDVAALIPIKNTMKGSLYDVVGELQDRELKVIAAARMDINSTIFGLGKPEEAETIAGKDVALEQISRYRPELARLAMSSTSAAAKHIAETGDTTMLAVGPSAQARHYGLTIHSENAQDRDGINRTSFLMVQSRQKWKYDPDNLTDQEVHGTMIFRSERSEEAGALSGALGEIAARAINLTNLEAMNIRGTEQMEFFVTFACTDRAIAKLALSESSKSMLQMDILGIYTAPKLYSS